MYREVHMTAREFLRRMEANEFPSEVCGCGCGQPLGPRVDGVRVMISGKEVNDDCYFEKLGEFVERHPIRKPR